MLLFNIITRVIKWNFCIIENWNWEFKLVGAFSAALKTAAALGPQSFWFLKGPWTESFGPVKACCLLTLSVEKGFDVEAFVLCTHRCPGSTWSRDTPSCQSTQPPLSPLPVCLTAADTPYLFILLIAISWDLTNGPWEQEKIMGRVLICGRSPIL